ncbi:hypothetical protein K2F40_15585 [Clostridium sp. CM028]|uniref:hypothetical protein n=1 Tax=Clostridium sp. CM028 TaxID=2851575 RepID=UPI001C6E546B|nr:hypothetical protein [Clostridium sp. CM028]MBW9150381.1 hypothetical protein [Clostridium sp. CM028]WLC63555.1 hypothetical protein KTC94_17405 [Clostridium sp. CM028]
MVLRPLSLLELKEIFDDTAIKVLEYFIKKAVFSQPERILGQEHLPIQVPKEHIEQWVVQAIGANPVGAGNYGVDVVKPGVFGADVKMLSCKIDALGNVTDSDSGETSLAQNFKDTGISLDQLFQVERYDEIVDGWKKIIQYKLEKVKVEQSVEKIYYIFILRAGTSFKLCGMEVDVDELQNIRPSHASSSSLFIDNFIDSNYGGVKIYKAKKRMELRLRAKYWVDHNMTLNFALNFNSEQVNIRDLVENNTISDYEYKMAKSSFFNER